MGHGGSCGDFSAEANIVGLVLFLSHKLIVNALRVSRCSRVAMAKDLLLLVVGVFVCKRSCGGEELCKFVRVWYVFGMREGLNKAVTITLGSL